MKIEFGSGKKLNLDVNYKDILVTTGASEAILFTINSCLDNNDEIIIPEPFYANYNGFAAASNVKVIPITAKIQDNFSLPSISSFEEKINKNTKAIFLCNPCNPTGYVYSKEEIHHQCKAIHTQFYCKNKNSYRAHRRRSKRGFYGRRIL